MYNLTCISLYDYLSTELSFDNIAGMHYQAVTLYQHDKEGNHGNKDKLSHTECLDLRDGVYNYIKFFCHVIYFQALTKFFPV